MPVAHTSHIRIEKHEGPHRTAHVEDFADPIHFSIHGGIKHFYQEKYGREIIGPEYPATLDHIIAGVGGWLTGTLGTALDVRGIKSAGNLVAHVEGDIEDADGVLKITKIRLKYYFKIPPDTKEKAERALALYADMCPAYQTVKDCIEVSWDAEMDESWRMTFDRMKEINTNVKVLLSSGYGIEGEAKEILKRGCDAFIQKPFKLEPLSQKIRKVLDEK